MEITVKNKKELKELLNQTTDKTAYVIEFEKEKNTDESDRTEQSGA
jgi:hypothetical protein